MKQDKENKSREQKEKEGAPRQPDPETLGTTDPQDHMKGPVSSAVQKVREGVDEIGTEDLKKRKGVDERGTEDLKKKRIKED